MRASGIAWQPFTPGGVAAFARTRLAHLFILQSVTALAAVGCVLWFLGRAWLPVMNAAIQQLPSQGFIRHAKLNWTGAPAVVLAENRFLAFSVDLEHKARVRTPADVQVEFGERDIVVYSLLGLIQSRYPQGWIVAFNRDELQPWWGAWCPVLLAIAGVSVLVVVPLCWLLLSTLYCPIAWLVAFFGDRELTLRGAWRLSGAALMPGALVLLVAILLYSVGVVDVVRLIAAFVGHFVVSWVFVIVSPLWCPRVPSTLATPKQNPFSVGRNQETDPVEKPGATKPGPRGPASAG